MAGSIQEPFGTQIQAHSKHEPSTPPVSSLADVYRAIETCPDIPDAMKPALVAMVKASRAKA